MRYKTIRYDNRGLLSLLALPVVGQVVGVYLISKLILSAIGILEVKKEKLLLPVPIK